MGWTAPTGHNDPDNAWNDEALAHDGDTGTYAASDAVVAGQWSKFIELTIDAINCDKIRFWAVYVENFREDCDIDVFYEDDWHDVYQGSFVAGNWVEKDIPAGAKSVTKARFRQYIAWEGLAARLYEFEFWEEIVAVGRSFGFIIG